MTVPAWNFAPCRRTYDGRAALDQFRSLSAPATHSPGWDHPVAANHALRLLAGWKRLRTVRFCSADVLSPSRDPRRAAHQRGIAMVFQDLALWPICARETTSRSAWPVTQLSRGEARARAQMLALCGLRPWRIRKPGHLSGGEQQRVALAAALAPHPKFLLLDSPFRGLDLVTKARLLQEITTLAASTGGLFCSCRMIPWTL